MKGNFYKRITRYYGYGRVDLWYCGRKTRKIIKTNDAKRYRRYRKKIALKDLESTDPLAFCNICNAFLFFSRVLQPL